MGEENRKGPGIFYAVIGVATLVVAIIGATFAYFTATATDDDTVTGTAATTGLSLTVDKISTDATGGLIPIAESLLNNGLAGDTASGEKMCLDKDSNTVCQVYRITVENTGTVPARLDGTLTLSATGYTNLKWANINKDSGLTSDATPDEVGSNLNASSVTSITANELFAASQTKYYYVMVYINETNASQNDTDKGSFTGSVTFSSAGGTGTTATFTA